MTKFSSLASFALVSLRIGQALSEVTETGATVRDQLDHTAELGLAKGTGERASCKDVQEYTQYFAKPSQNSSLKRSNLSSKFVNATKTTMNSA